MRVCVGSPGTFSTRKWRSARARDLGKVGDRDDLGVPGEPAERVSDRMRGPAADPGVDLVEDHGLAACDGGDRERDPGELAARGRLGDRPEGQPCVRADREPRLVGIRTGLDPSHAARPGTPPPRARHRRARSPPPLRNAVQPRGGRPEGPPGGGRPRPGRRRRASAAARAGSWPSASASSSRSGGCRPFDQLGERVGAVATAKVGDLFEPALDLFEPARLGLERVEEAAKLDSDLAERKLGAAESLPGRGELRRDRLERRDARSALATRSAPPSRSSGEIAASAFAAAPASSVTFRRRSRAALSSSSSPGSSPSVSAASARSSSSRASAAAASRVSSSCARRAAASSRQARRALRVSVGRAGERVEHRQLVRRPREPPLLELPAHRQQRLDDLRDVLARRTPSPRVGACPAVGEDPPGEHERVLVRRPQLGEVPEHLGVGEVELRLDVGLLATRRRSTRPRPALRAGGRSRSRGSSSPLPSRR